MTTGTRQPSLIASLADYSWHAHETDDALRRLESDRSGLSDEEAGRRLEQVGPNRLMRSPPVSAWKILGDQLTSVVVGLLAPSAIAPERLSVRDESTARALGGVEGGVPGGITGGIVGGIVSPAPPPPPPPPPPLPSAPAARAPVRIGGQVTAPALLHRVEPIYPDVAALAHLSGMVILQAVVNTDGCVESVNVLRSCHLLLDKASEDALLQWRYSPLILNGVPLRSC